MLSYRTQHIYTPTTDQQSTKTTKHKSQLRHKTIPNNTIETRTIHTKLLSEANEVHPCDHQDNQSQQPKTNQPSESKSYWL
ncbi:MAG: hypothetical protein VYD39_02485 [Bacteroidota bacterium]|nr:hypothetical protein [Bacteroidota bacterium]